MSFWFGDFIEIETSCPVMVFFSKLLIIFSVCAVYLPSFYDNLVKWYFATISFVWFYAGIFDSNFVVEAVLRVHTIVDHIFYFNLRISSCLCKTSLHTIDELVSLSNNILIVYVVCELILDFIKILLHSYRIKIIPEVVSNESVGLIFVSLFEFNLLLGWLIIWDLMDMWFKLVFLK